MIAECWLDVLERARGDRQSGARRWAQASADRRLLLTAPVSITGEAWAACRRSRSHLALGEQGAADRRGFLISIRHLIDWYLIIWYYAINVYA